MRQTWKHLLFLHAPIDPERLRPLVPPPLEIDLFPDETGVPMAWVGLVVFGIEAIRLGTFPPIPGLSGFAEANVRTYVHLTGRDPSVLFLSLDGGPWLTRAVARAWYGVPYVPARTSLLDEVDTCEFKSRRPDGTLAEFRYRVERPAPTPEPGSFEYFALERYQLLAPVRNGLRKARIWHAPYKPFVARWTGESDLPESHGLSNLDFGRPLYCDTVRAEFFAPEFAPATL